MWAISRSACRGGSTRHTLRPDGVDVCYIKCCGHTEYCVQVKEPSGRWMGLSLFAQPSVDIEQVGEVVKLEADAPETAIGGRKAQSLGGCLLLQEAVCGRRGIREAGRPPWSIACQPPTLSTADWLPDSATAKSRHFRVVVRVRKYVLSVRAGRRHLPVGGIKPGTQKWCGVSIDPGPRSHRVTGRRRRR